MAINTYAFDQDQLAGLLARLAATPQLPSAELDCRLHQLVHPQHRVLLDPGDTGGPGRPRRDAQWGVLADFPLGGWENWHELAIHIGAAPVTSSMDVAQQLLSEVLGIKDTQFIFSRAFGDAHPGNTDWWHEVIRTLLTDLLEELARRAQAAADLAARASDTTGARP